MIRIQITDGTGLQDERRWVAGLNTEVDYIQVRERDASPKQLMRLVRAAMEVAPVLVNDRADVALACGAAGVHLRSGSVAAAKIRKLGSLVVMVACHSSKEVDTAVGADYAVLAPIFLPLSKSDSRQPLGIAELKRVCCGSRVPIIALGGVTAENAALCGEAGATGIAGITLFRRRRQL